VEDADDRISFSIAHETKDEVDAKEDDDDQPKDEHSETKSEEKSSTDASKKTAGIVDPLRWFGILVPPALRTAQSNFITAVEGTVPQLANVTRVLRNQEIEIGRIRKQIKKL
jgi:hypothetical protein